MRKWLRDLREKKCLSQKDLAEKIGVAEGNYSRLENGLRGPNGLTVALVARIAEATGEKPVKVLQAEIDWLKEADHGTD